MKKNIFQALLSVLIFSSLVIGQTYYTDPYATKKPTTPTTVQPNPYGTTYNTTPSTSIKSTYDWNSGNSYTTIKSGNGTTQTNGYNSTTGSSWQNNYNSNGNMTGQDKKGNTWDYNKSTGVYNNYGTGEVRINGESLYKPKKK